MPLSLTVLLLWEIQIGFGFTFLVPAHPGSPGQNPDSCTIVIVAVVVICVTLCMHQITEILQFQHCPVRLIIFLIFCTSTNHLCVMWRIVCIQNTKCVVVQKWRKTVLILYNLKFYKLTCELVCHVLTEIRLSSGQLLATETHFTVKCTEWDC